MDSFSNRDKDVFLITCEKMIDRGALMSRYSRTRELDIRTLWDKEFADVPDRAEKFYERVFLEYGDESVSELATAQVGIQNVSNVLSKIIEESRIGLSFLEKSSRYVSYREKRNGRYLFIDPEKAGIPRKFHERYEEFNNHIFELYNEIFTGVSNYIHEKNPFENMRFYLPNGKEVKLGEESGDEEVLKRAYESSVRSRALDETRFILPASTLTNIGLSGNARAFSHLLERLKANGLKEADKLYSELMTELKLVFPKLIENVENPHGLESVEYLRKIKNYVPDQLEVATSPTKETVKLLSFESNDTVLNKVLASYYFERTAGNYETLHNHFSDLSAEEKVELLNRITSLRTNRRNKLDRSFEHVYYTFEINTNFGAFRDLQRHRSLTIQRKMLSTVHGYDIPPIISAIRDLSEKYVKAIEKANTLYEEIRSVDPLSAQYVVIFAHIQPVIVTLNLRELLYLTELRSTPQAHFDLRKISREMVGLVKKVNPSLDKVFKFLNENDEELGRLSAELRKEIKLKRD
ncbi:MAG: FAD-dependent thymidylate synthase [Thermoplasmatales archaeon]